MFPRWTLPTLVVLSLVLVSTPARAANGTWNLLPNSPTPTATTGRHDDLSFINDRVGWLVNGDGDIYSTTNGGSTWTHLVNTGVYNRSVVFTDSLHGVVGYLYRKLGTPLSVTTDAGVTWTLITPPGPVPRGICGLSAPSGQVIYGVGAYYGYPTLLKSIDNGATWTTKSMSAYCGALVDCHFWAPDSGIAVGSTTADSTRTPVVLRTTDGGATWSIRWTGTRTDELCWKISMVNRQVGFVSIENLKTTGAAYYLKTKDGGLTWKEELFESSYRDCQGIGFVDESTGWIGGWDMNTEATHDSGATWVVDPGLGREMNRFRFLSPTVGYACGDRVYKWTGEVVSGVADLGPFATPRLLQQNSPNPFRRQTRIDYRVAEAGPVTLKLYDLQGREIMSLFQGTRQPGRYEALIDGGPLAQGVYAYTLVTASGKESRKLLVIR